MRLAPTTRAAFCLIVATTCTLAREDDGAKTHEANADESRADALGMTPAIACRSIDGYDRYEVLPGAALTSDEKLLVYYQPLHYQVDETAGSYHLHLTQDGKIRRRGQKEVLLRKDNLLDYEVKGKMPPDYIYARNTVALKGLKPGEYEFEIILYDKLAKTPPATQLLKFRVIPAAAPEAATKTKDKKPGGSRPKKS
jgi:hypothetical protein